MALAESVAAPFVSATGSNSVTSASFTPTAGSLLVAIASNSNGLASSDAGLAVSDSLSGSWRALVHRGSTTTTPWSDCSVWVRDIGNNPQAMTVTAANPGTGVKFPGLIVKQFTGALPAVQQNGATTVQQTQSLSSAITATQSGSQIVCAFGDASDGVTWTAISGTVIDGQQIGASNDSVALIESGSTSVSGQQFTLGFSNAGKPSNPVVFAMAEILPAPDPRLTNFNDAAIRSVLDKIVSYALASGRFDAVNQHEPKSAPGNQITFAVWVQSIKPVPRASGLTATSGVILFTGRIYQNFRSQPFDMIDPAVTAACTDMMGALSGDFNFGGVGNVRSLDLLGMYGPSLSAAAGYVEIDKNIYRVMTIQIPVIINDMFAQVA